MPLRLVYTPDALADLRSVLCYIAGDTHQRLDLSSEPSSSDAGTPACNPIWDALEVISALG